MSHFQTSNILNIFDGISKKNSQGFSYVFYSLLCIPPDATLQTGRTDDHDDDTVHDDDDDNDSVDDDDHDDDTVDDEDDENDSVDDGDDCNDQYACASFQSG